MSYGEEACTLEEAQNKISIPYIQNSLTDNELPVGMSSEESSQQLIDTED